MKPFPLATINYFILSKHHLTPKTKIDNILQIAHDICGLHSTSQTTPYLSLFSRTNSFQKEDLEKEAYEKKNLGKIRCMRKTIFRRFSFPYMQQQRTFMAKDEKLILRDWGCLWMNITN
ncbi:MAG: DNA glycosylase AlkZ-like family protein [Candidatus Heimdallarchaeaceae archaeon]